METSYTSSPNRSDWATPHSRTRKSTSPKHSQPSVNLASIQAWMKAPTWLSREQAQAFNGFCDTSLRERTVGKKEVGTLQIVRSMTNYLIGMPKTMSNQLNYVVYYLTPLGRHNEGRQLFTDLLSAAPIKAAQMPSIKLFTLTIREYNDQGYFDSQKLPTPVRQAYEKLLTSQGQDRSAYKTFLMELEKSITGATPERTRGYTELMVLADIFQNPDMVIKTFGWRHFTMADCNPAYVLMNFLKVRHLGIIPGLLPVVLSDYLDTISRNPSTLSPTKLTENIAEIRKRYPSFNDKGLFIQCRNAVEYSASFYNNMPPVQQKLYREVLRCLHMPETMGSKEALETLYTFINQHNKAMPCALKEHIQKRYHQLCDSMTRNPPSEEIFSSCTQALNHCAEWLPDELQYLPFKTNHLLQTGNIDKLATLVSQFPQSQFPQISEQMRTYTGIAQLHRGETSTGWKTLASVLGKDVYDVYQTIMGTPVPIGVFLPTTEQSTTPGGKSFCKRQLQIYKNKILENQTQQSKPMLELMSHTPSMSQNDEQDQPYIAPATRSCGFSRTPGAERRRRRL